MEWLLRKRWRKLVRLVDLRKAVITQLKEGPLSSLQAVDSTGIKPEDEGEWNARKHGSPKRRIWRNTCIARQSHSQNAAERVIDEEILEIRAVEVTSSSIDDAPMLLTYSIISNRTKK
jgi:hypothetical protein